MSLRSKPSQASGQKGPPLLRSHVIEDLEQDLVATLYKLREAEDQLSPEHGRSEVSQREAMSHLVSIKKHLSAIELALRTIRHGY